MKFINDTKFDIKITIDDYEFVIPKHEERELIKLVNSCLVSAIPCRKSKTKIKIPFAGFSALVKENLTCELVCSCNFLITDINPTSVICFTMIETEIEDGIKYVSLHLKSNDLTVSDISFELSDHLKAKQKYKALLLFVVYGLFLWICGIVFGIVSKDYIATTVGFIAAVLSLIFYKINVDRLEKNMACFNKGQFLLEKTSEMDEDEEFLNMLDEFGNNQAKTKLEKSAVHIVKSIYRKLM